MEETLWEGLVGPISLGAVGRGGWAGGGVFYEGCGRCRPSQRTDISRSSVEINVVDVDTDLDPMMG